MPSLRETLGDALFKAMATELPAVGSAVGGVPEVIVPNETGFVVPACDPTRLAGSLRVLLGDAALRVRFGRPARVACDFHERGMVQKTLDIYRKVSRCHPGR